MTVVSTGRPGRLVRAAAVLLIGLLLAGCSSTSRRRLSNVRPPHPGRPASAADVQGIYRSMGNRVLQLRGNGDFVLITPSLPSAGAYALRDGRLEVRTPSCGDVLGTYEVEVTGEPKPGKAMLRFAAVNDPCELRREYLTTGPWVYANS